MPLLPPAKMKVFAPNGDMKEAVCWMVIRGHRIHQQVVELLLLHEDGTTEVLNKRVVVQNLETGEVVYNPRIMPACFGSRTFMTDAEVRWLRQNPHWPGILELYDNPVANGEETNGLHA
jgi:hypothetical protein